MIDFEHTLFILLLLTAIINAKPPRPRWATIIIMAGVLLVFIPPPISWELPWNIILGVTLPLLLWQNIRRITYADWHGFKSFALWISGMVLITAALWIGGAASLPGALLLGIVAASIIWRAGESESKASYMSQVGPVAIIFLLAEVEAAIQSPNRYMGGIFSGIFFGAVFAAIGISLIRRLPKKWHAWIGIGQVYLAYWFSFLAGVSAVSAAVFSVMVYFWLNRYFKLGLHEDPPPAPLNTWPGFLAILGLFLLLGLDGHQTISPLILVEVLIGTMIGLGITWLGMRWNIAAFDDGCAFWQTALRIVILLFPTLLIWPRDLIQEPIQLAVAIGLAVLVIGFAHLGLEFYFPNGPNRNNL